MTKTDCRRQLRRARAAVRGSQRSRAARRVARRIAASHHLRRARAVAVYLSHASELPTEDVIKVLHRRGKRVYVPVLRNRRMQFKRLRRSTRLRRGDFGIREPVGTRATTLRDLDVILLPLVGFDAAGHRLGAGGGFYDRTLERASVHRPLRVGLAFTVQEAPFVPTEPHDVPLRHVVTERGWHRLPRRPTHPQE